MRMEVTRRRAEGWLGKRPASWVLRLMRRLRDSAMLEVRRRRRKGSGSRKMEKASGTLASSQSANFGEDFRWEAATSARRAWARERSGESKMERMSAAI